MSPHDTVFEQDEYRLIFLRSGHQAIWVPTCEGRPHLPHIAIPRWKRPAEQLQQAIEGSLRLHAVVLDLLSGANHPSPCAIVEIRSSEAVDGLVPTPVDELLETELTGKERDIVDAILAGEKPLRSPFSRLGWVDEAFHWAREVAGANIAFTGETLQYNVAGASTLINFPTHEGAGYWLKATSEPTAHEFRITKMLAELCPEYLPGRIAEREDWNAWLMKEAGCSHESLSLPDLELAVSSMAILQQRTMSRAMDFEAAGASNQRFSILRAHLSELIEYLEEAMTKQMSTKVPRIERHRLRYLASLLDEACCRMEALRIPDTLVHNDMNSGNVLFQDGQCAFIDWHDVCISNPFLSFEYLCLLKSHGEEEWRPSLQEHYRGHWLGCLNGAQIDEALVLAPVLSMLGHLYSRVAGTNVLRRTLPHVESYARALARRIDRAAQDAQLLEVLCS